MPATSTKRSTPRSPIGDDRIQKQMQGRVVPEAFTHGSSAQRMRWLKRGLDSGRPQDCDTLGAQARSERASATA